jgi:hypothetical protein
VNKIGVNLAHGHQRPLAALSDGSQSLQKRTAILFHRAPRIFASESEIQALSAIGPRNTIHPGTKTMDEPWNCRERIGIENPALSFPESFQWHRNILAMSPHDVTNGKCELCGHKSFNPKTPITQSQQPFGYNAALHH